MKTNRAAEQVFEDLYRKHLSAIRSFFRRLGFSHEESLDLTQETFFRAYRGMDSFRGDGGTLAWLLIIAKNIYRNEVRRRRAESRSAATASLDMLEEESGLDIADERASAYQRTLTVEASKSIAAAISRLPPAMRSALILSLQGSSLRDIARLLRHSQDTVKATLYQARRRLSKDPALSQGFGEIAEHWLDLGLAKEDGAPGKS